MPEKSTALNKEPVPVNRLRIAMVIDAYDDSTNGAVISTKRFVELLRKDHEVSIITTGKPAPGKILLRKFYAPVVTRVMKKMKTPLAVPSDRILKKAIRNMDLIHVQFPFFLGVRVIRLANRYGIPVVSTFHIQAEHLSMNAGIRSKQFIRYCYRFWIRNIYNRSDAVICPSHFAEEELKSNGLRSRSVVISNGLLPDYHPVMVDRPESLRDKFIILSVGRFAPEKRQEMIIRAVSGSRYRDRIQLILIGEGPLREKLEECGKDLSSSPLFLKLPPEELVYYYNIADLYVHVASVEVECMTVLEAIGCGLPSLIGSGPKSATSQFALDDRFLFDCQRETDLVQKIDYWIDHPEELQRSKKLYVEESSGYRIEQSYEKLVSLYRSVIRKSQ